MSQKFSYKADALPTELYWPDEASYDSDLTICQHAGLNHGPPATLVKHKSTI